MGMAIAGSIALSYGRSNGLSRTAGTCQDGQVDAESTPKALDQYGAPRG